MQIHARNTLENSRVEGPLLGASSGPGRPRPRGRCRAKRGSAGSSSVSGLWPCWRVWQLAEGRGQL